jgi:hypothetical protein
MQRIEGCGLTAARPESAWRALSEARRSEGMCWPGEDGAGERSMRVCGEDVTAHLWEVRERMGRAGVGRGRV